MPTGLRFRLIFAAIFLVGLFALYPPMQRMRAMNRCYDSGNVWDFSARVCVAPINPHPTVADTATPRVKRRIVPEHKGL